MEVCIPMPAEVGNALFRYITEERGKNASPKIFLSEKAQHKAVGRFVCRNAFRTALTDRKVEGSHQILLQERADGKLHQRNQNQF